MAVHAQRDLKQEWLDRVSGDLLSRPLVPVDKVYEPGMPPNPPNHSWARPDPTMWRPTSDWIGNFDIPPDATEYTDPRTGKTYLFRYDIARDEFVGTTPQEQVKWHRLALQRIHEAAGAQ